MSIQFKLPELGENVESGEVISVLVKTGDVIKPDQAVLEMETGKATVEVPSPLSGTVSEIHVRQGDNVVVGQLVLTVEGGGEEPGADAADQEVPAAVQATKKARTTKDASREVASTEPAPTTIRARPEAGPLDENAAPDNGDRPTPAPGHLPVFASPSVRQLAREVGVDIAQVPGSGPGGRIGIEDIKSFARSHRGAAPASPVASMAVPALPDFARFGDIERKPMSNVRKATADHMAMCWNLIPHVTHHHHADVTHLESLRKKFQTMAEAAETKLTVTAILVKVVAVALKVHPKFNASIDMARREIVYKKYCNVGVAVDTPRGLVVPVIREADTKSILQLSKDLNVSAKRARDGKVSANDLQGGSFTITNLGGLGTKHFSPIVNYPEVAILGVGRAGAEPVVRDGEIRPRLMLPLSLSYDHRLIDGADAARFMSWIVQAIEQPFLLSLEG